ncbi:MAG: excisionase family DNA-binding protein [Ignavibacterium sp.]|jgi:excisionase family DNA binding protein|nr:excisionase family DNA-binding protein [Ignavibacterium sp.]
MAILNVSKIYKELDEIKSLIAVSKAEYIGIEEAAKHLGLAKTYLYSLIHQGRIPFYKPNGKKVYFNKLELNKWISQSKVKSIDELDRETTQPPLTSN